MLRIESKQATVQPVKNGQSVGLPDVDDVVRCELLRALEAAAGAG